MTRALRLTLILAIAAAAALLGLSLLEGGTDVRDAELANRVEQRERAMVAQLLELRHQRAAAAAAQDAYAGARREVRELARTVRRLSDTTFAIARADSAADSAATPVVDTVTVPAQVGRYVGAVERQAAACDTALTLTRTLVEAERGRGDSLDAQLGDVREQLRRATSPLTQLRRQKRAFTAGAIAGGALSLTAALLLSR